VEKLKKHEEEALDDKRKKGIEGRVSLKTLERDLAEAKLVREISWHYYLNVRPTNIMSPVAIYFSVVMR
jgi:hypothetical protein